MRRAFFKTSRGRTSHIQGLSSSTKMLRQLGRGLPGPHGAPCKLTSSPWGTTLQAVKADLGPSEKGCAGPDTQWGIEAGFRGELALPRAESQHMRRKLGRRASEHSPRLQQSWSGSCLAAASGANPRARQRQVHTQSDSTRTRFFSAPRRDCRATAATCGLLQGFCGWRVSGPHIRKQRLAAGPSACL